MTVLIDSLALRLRANCPFDESPLYANPNGDIVCSHRDCVRPRAATELLTEKQATSHLVSLDEHGFSVVHPLWERFDDVLLTCPLGTYVAEHGQEDWLGTGQLRPGVTYRMWALSGVSRTPEGDDHYYEVEWPVDDRGDAIPFAEEH